MSVGRRKFAGLLRKLGVLLVVIGAIVSIFVMAKFLPWSISWDFWTVLTAIGTIGATIVALALALRSWFSERDATARVISAWVADEYRPRDDGVSYIRDATLHVANESDEPVFNAFINVHIGRDAIPIGPLAAPFPISVIPAHRELVFDISVPLLAHSGAWSPRAELTFVDPRGRRWFRGLNGEVQDVSHQGMSWSREPGHQDERQLGAQDSPFNPMFVALTFLGSLQVEGMKEEDLRLLLAPEAAGWTDVNWDQLRSELANFNPTSMVDYPAPRIARVKLSGDKSLEGMTVEGFGTPLELGNSMFMTLILDPRSGWRIFEVGESVSPDQIYFGGSLIDDLEPYKI